MSKFAIPYTFGLLDALNRHNFKSHISEIYFSNYISARNIKLSEIETKELKQIKNQGYKLNYLFNPQSFDNSFYLEEGFNNFFNIVKTDYEYFKFDFITITNTFLLNIPIFRLFCKSNKIEIKVSTNNGVSSLKELQIYHNELSINNLVLDRSINRNLDELDKCVDYAKQNNIRLTLLLNEGCLPNCQYKNFCDQIISQYHKQNIEDANIVLNVFESLGCSTNFKIIPEKTLQSPFISPTWLQFFEDRYDSFLEYKIVGRNKDIDTLETIITKYINKDGNVTLYYFFSTEKPNSYKSIYFSDLDEYNFFEKIQNCKTECYNCPHSKNNENFCSIIYKHIKEN